MSNIHSDIYLNPIVDWDYLFAHQEPVPLPTVPSEEPQPSLGKRLRTFRETAGYTQKGLQELSGVNYNRISIYELDKRIPKEKVLYQLEPFLHFTSDIYDLAEKARQARDKQHSRLRELRLAKKLTLVALGNLSGVDFRILSDAERGIYSLKKKQIAKLASHLDVTVTELLQCIEPVRKIGGGSVPTIHQQVTSDS